MSKTKEIKKWAKTKTKKELEKAITQLIEHGIMSEDLSFRKYPYCAHSGEPLVKSDEGMDEED